MAISQGKEDYIKAIYKLNGNVDYVSNKLIATELNISPPSVSDMLKKMEKEELVDLVAYKGVKLTEKGLNLAIDVIRRHRIVEVFLYETLGYDLSELDEDAEQMEHITSPVFYKRLEKFLEYPTYCPHGSLIPSYEQYEETSNVSLIHSEKGNDVVINRILDKKELMDFLDQIELKIGDQIKIVNNDEINKIVVFEHLGTQKYVGYQLASMMFYQN